MMPAKTDTGLHVSMRLFLGIVAGLLISDMLKAAVKTIGAGAASYPIAWANAFIVLAAILFLIRIVVDNVLYYNDPDARTTTPAYGARVALIFIDLTSYGVCYHMVAVIEPDAGRPAAFAINVGRAVASDMALVELLHFIWCIVAIVLLPVTAAERSERVPLLRRWAWLSAIFAVLSFAAWRVLKISLSGLAGATIVFLISLASAITYMLSMREQQYLGPETAWRA